MKPFKRFAPYYLWGLWGLAFALNLCPWAAAEEPTAPVVVELLAIGPGARENNRECGATGLLVNSAGYILTNAHVIDEARGCLAQGGGSKVLAKFSARGPNAARAVSCDLVGVDKVHDLALIKTERPSGVVLSADQPHVLILDSSEVAPGARVLVTGYPLFAWEPVTQSGKLIGRASARLSDSSAEPSDLLVLDVPLRPGNSGSPVYLTGTARVVGIIEGREPRNPSHTIAVPIRYAVELLNRYAVEWHGAAKGIQARELRANTP